MQLMQTIDFQKAFDSVSWVFLYQTLQRPVLGNRLFDGFMMESYELKAKGPKEKCVKIFCQQRRSKCWG